MGVLKKIVCMSVYSMDRAFKFLASCFFIVLKFVDLFTCLLVVVFCLYIYYLFIYIIIRLCVSNDDDRRRCVYS